jgi:hypothetical protein
MPGDSSWLANQGLAKTPVAWEMLPREAGKQLAIIRKTAVNARLRTNQMPKLQYESQNARFSRCRHYRYSLERCWQGGRGRVLFIGLNPSTADHRQDDPTIRRCVNYAHDWGFAAVEVVNLFAYRATYPTDLKSAADPVGKRNDYWIRRCHRQADLTVACWGNDGLFNDRAFSVLEMLSDLYCLQLNRSRQPAHPLYQRADRKPQPLSRLLASLS